MNQAITTFAKIDAESDNLPESDADALFVEKMLPYIDGNNLEEMAPAAMFFAFIEPGTHKITGSSIEGDNAQVEISFQSSMGAGTKTDKVSLKKINGSWKIVP